MAEKSRFAGLRSLREPELPMTPEKPQALSRRTRAKLAASPDAPGETPPPPATIPQPSAEAATQPKKRGRPPGKKSSADYEQTTIFLNVSLKWKAKLYMLDKSTDLSMLINAALEDYLNKNATESKRSVARTLMRVVKATNRDKS